MADGSEAVNSVSRAEGAPWLLGELKQRNSKSSVLSLKVNLMAADWGFLRVIEFCEVEVFLKEEALGSGGVFGSGGEEEEEEEEEKRDSWDLLKGLELYKGCRWRSMPTS